MSKKGVSKIVGNSSPRTGVTTLYKVAEWYPATPAASRSEALVTWELFKKRADGKFTTTNIKKKGRGEFTFGSKAHLYTYKVEGYLHSPEGVSPMSMVITPQKNDKQPTAEKNILGIKLTYRDGSAVAKTLSYRDQLRATAKCQNLEGKTLVFTLWEDDENGAGHHVKNQKILQSPPILVDRKGYARWDFTLLTTFIALANKREDDKKQHEYYVTAEYNGKMNASGNVNANNPQFKKPPTAVQPKLKPTPNAPKTSTNPASKHNQPDKKGIIRSIKLADKDGNAFTKKPKFGDTISVIIDARNVKGLSYTLRLWEHDNIGDHDLLYNNTHIFKSDLQRALITLTGKMQKIGEIGNNPKKPDSGEYLTGNYQEIFAEVIFEKVSAKSAVIDVGIMEAPKKQNNGEASTNVREGTRNKQKVHVCFCNRDFTIAELKDLVKTIKGKEKIWEGIKEQCEIDDKSWEGLTNNLNAAFKKYKINRCMQKISFLAQVNEETGFFTQSKEELSQHKSSQSTYKGRGLLQLTGDRDSTGYYNAPGAYLTYGRYIGAEDKVVGEPDIVSKQLKYAVDVGGYIFSVNKKVPAWKVRESYSQQEKEAVQWKMEYFAKGLGKSLNELGFLMEDEEEKYFYLQAKILNGYSIVHKLDRDPNGWNNRKNSLKKLKEWFKYDKNICNGNIEGVAGNQSHIVIPPWMHVALNEFTTFSGQNHNNHTTLQKRIEEYFDNTVYKEGTYKENWCAAFVTWCLNKGNPSYSEPSSYGSVRARAFSTGLFSDHSWEKGKTTKDNAPAYGATAMIVWDGGGQHVAFVTGKTANGNIAVLGGNQSVKNNKVTVGRGITKTSVSPKNIKCYMFPKDFKDDESLYELNSEDITDQINSRNDTHAN